MTFHEAPGLRGNWLNGWLAAIGITVLLPDARLSWSSDAVPIAIFEFQGNLIDELAKAIPSEQDLSALAIARKHAKSNLELPWKVSPEAFSDRSHLARISHDGSLEVTFTDLVLDKEGCCKHGPLNLQAPRGLTLHDRLMNISRNIDRDPRSAIEASLKGNAQRREGNGLGFDWLRFPAGVHKRDKGSQKIKLMIDPFIELACFFGMKLMPVRGSGGTVRQRGWSDSHLKRSVFSWPVWKPSLDRWAIDALLDVAWETDEKDVHRNWGISGFFRSVAYKPQTPKDVLGGYASERLW
jgi:hypothetical protein